MSKFGNWEEEDYTSGCTVGRRNVSKNSAMFCQETLDITIQVNVTLNVYPFMESVFPDGIDLSFSRVSLRVQK